MMPLYEYHDADTGLSIEMRRDVEDRNKPIVLTRVKTVPDRIAICGLGPTQEQQFNADILRGWYKQEEKQGSSLDTGEFSKEQIKQIWSE